MANEHILKVHGMHCESCERIISRTVEKHEGAKAISFDLRANTMKIECADAQLPKIKEELLSKGYQLLLPGEEAKQGYEAGSFSRIFSFLSSLLTGSNGFAHENAMLFYSALTLVAILMLQSFLYIFAFRNIPNFLNIYGTLLFLAAISIVAVMFSFFHVRAFKERTSCMVGMMMGMSIGMMGGFLIGAFAGATSGMFVGSLAGMAFGMFLGFEAGRCCGVMGGMEGLMGGLMAGTMGAMLSVMMLSDHLMLFLFILTGIAITILAGLSYLAYKEFGNLQKMPISALQFAAYCIAIDLLVSAILVFAPKSGLVWGG